MLGRETPDRYVEISMRRTLSLSIPLLAEGNNILE